MEKLTIRTRRRGALLLGASIVLGCDGPAAPPTRATLSERIFVESESVTAWIRGGTETDTILLKPLGLVADRARVYVLDPIAHRVTALRASDGVVDWTAGGEGGGPHEFNAPSALALSPLGEVVVADPQNRRLAVLGRDGGLRSHIPLRGEGYPVPCALSPTRPSSCRFSPAGRGWSA